MSAPRDRYAGGAGARYWLLGSAFFLTAFGLVMIYSASSIVALSREGDSTVFLIKQLAAAGLGWALALGLARFDYRRLKGSAMAVWGVCVALLGLVVFYGAITNGAKRWIPLGVVNLQPSELAKIGCVIAISAIAVEWQRGRLIGKDFGMRALLLTAVPAGLIILQPDMGTTATLVVTVVIVFLLAGVGFRWVFGAGAVLGGLGVVFIALEPYRMQRVTGFLNPWDDPAGKGYQIIQALYAFGSGGIDGVGLGLSRQKFFYLPEAHTDFILAIIGEEAGLLGTLAVVAGFCIFVWAGFRIANGARDGYGRLVAGGLTGMIAFQAVINMAAVTGMMPVTGKPLPFVSYGGSSMIVTMIAVGLLLSVSEYGMLAPRAVRARRPSEERVSESPRERRRDSGAHIPRPDRSRPARRRA